MPTSNQLTGAPIPMKIKNGTGKIQEFKASTLTDYDYAELDAFVQDEIVDISRRRLEDLLPSERQELMSAAIKAAAGVTWSSPEGLRILNSRKGSIRMGWQMVKEHHPELDFNSFFETCIKNKDKKYHYT